MTVDGPLPRPTLTADRRRLVLLLVAVLLLLAAAVPLGLRERGVNASTTGETSSGRAAADTSEAGTASTPAPGPTLGTAGRAGAPAAAAVVTAKIARSAWLGLHVPDLAAASSRARAIAAAAGGTVTAENVVTAPAPAGSARPVPSQEGGIPPVAVDEARITVRVPAGKLDAVLTELAGLGTVSYRTSQAEDVTDAYVDTSARIAPMRDSVERVRALLAKATDLQQIVLLESELSRRQADLDSLQQRLAELDRRTTTSDVTLTLWAGSASVGSGTNGFVVTLREAWSALLGSLGVIVTGLAVLLPWLVIGLGAAALARRGWRRRGWRRRGTPPPVSTAP